MVGSSLGFFVFDFVCCLKYPKPWVEEGRRNPKTPTANTKQGPKKSQLSTDKGPEMSQTSTTTFGQTPEKNLGHTHFPISKAKWGAYTSTLPPRLYRVASLHSLLESEKPESRFCTFNSARQKRAPPSSPSQWRPREKPKFSRGRKEVPPSSSHWGGVRKGIVESHCLEVKRPPPSSVVSGEAMGAAVRRHHYPSGSGRDQLRGEMELLLSTNWEVLSPPGENWGHGGNQDFPPNVVTPFSCQRAVRKIQLKTECLYKIHSLKT